MERQFSGRLTRRDMLKLGAGGAGMLALGASGLAITRGQAAGGSLYIEAFPTSPLITEPFRDDNPLPIPRAQRPVPPSVWKKWDSPPGPDKAQDSVALKDDRGAFDDFVAKYGWKPGTHQVWPGRGVTKDYPWLSTTPLVYHLPLKVGTHTWTTSPVQPIDNLGQDFQPPGRPGGLQQLPESVIYGFNGAFPGSRINAEYGRPVLIRFDNQLDKLPQGLTEKDRLDFGAPNHAFLTHLHNGHTAAESDGNPHYTTHRFHPLGRHHERAAYEPGEWLDNLYLNYPAGGDDSQKQSFLWFHDHTHGHTGANVYKGMVGLYPIYDPYDGKDMGEETQGLRLPGVRTDNGDGSFDVDYDIPLALYDVRLDDGATIHKDAHNPDAGVTHPDWWGKHFFQHFPNHGFVGDVFTVNCKAYPVLRVKRRRYRLRFLGASISRIYDLQLMRSAGGPKSASKDLGLTGTALQGQWRLPDGEQCMKLTQIASEGGLLEHPVVRDSFELWPANRREFVVDFSKYMDNTPTTNGQVIYLVNTMLMTDGRMPDVPQDPTYKVPVLKIIIDGDAEDNSRMPVPEDTLRKAPDHPAAAAVPALVKDAKDQGRQFVLSRGSAAGQPETEWVINGVPFDAEKPLIQVHRGDADVWVISTGGGWVHPMHLHMEEHIVLSRNGHLTGAPDADPRHMDDTGKMDVVSLDPSEEVAIHRSFRSFTGPYVAHCHNLAHEDHNMMFGWDLLPADGDPLPDQSPLPREDDGSPKSGGGGTTAGGAVAGGAGAAAGTKSDGGKGRKGAKKTVATLSVKLMRSNGRRIVRLKVSDSRGKAKQRLTIRVRHAGRDVLVRHPSLRKGRGSIDIPLSRSLKGRYDVVLVLDDGTTVRKALTIR